MARSTPLAQKDSCAKSALARMDVMNITEISHMFFACARGGYVNGELFEAMAQRARSTLGMMVQMMPANTRLLFQSMALLGRLGDEALSSFPSCHRFCKALVAVTIKQERGRFMDSNEYNLTTTLHCVGTIFKMGMISKGEAVNLVGVLMYRLQAESRIPRCTPQELANVLHGCAVVGYVGRPQIRRICEQIQCLLAVPRSSLRIITVGFNAPMLASIIWSLGKLGVHDGLRLDVLGEDVVKRITDMSGREIVQVLHGFVSLGYDNREILDKVCLEAVKPTRILSLDTQEIANLLYGVSRLGYEKDMMDDLVQEAIKPKRLVEFSRAAICTVVQSVGQMKHFDSNSLAPLITEILEPARLEILRNQCDTHLCSFVYGLGLLQQHFTDQQLFMVVCSFLDKTRAMGAVKGLSCRDTAYMCWGLAKLRFYNQWFMDRMISQFLNAMDAQNSDRIEKDALMLLHACALLNHKNEKFLSFMVKKIELFSQSVKDSQGIVNMIWALAVLGHLTRGLLAHLASRLVLLGPINSASEAKQFLQGWQAVTGQANALPTRGVPEMQFESAILYLIDSAKTVLLEQGHPGGMSEFEADVTNRIKSLGIPLKQKVCTQQSADVLSLTGLHGLGPPDLVTSN